MKARKHRFLWITDPWDSLDQDSDTTLRLAREAIVLGHESHWCDVRSIRLEGSRVSLEAAAFGADSGKEGHVRPFPTQLVEPGYFQSIHYRVDPPVDLGYLHPLQLLMLSPAAKASRIVNPPSVLFSRSEKTEASVLGDLMPESLVSSQWEALARFGKSLRRTVLKPLHLAQSRDVRLLSWENSTDTENNLAILAALTEQFHRPVMLQRYLPGISEGEQRLWFIDGKLLACVRKLPLHGDFRVNIDAGSALKKTSLNAAEKKASSRIGRRLRELRVRLAAVDLIEGKVTDFNFTSPGLLIQMEKVLGENLARPVIRALARSL